jgi:hypothetical protein
MLLILNARILFFVFRFNSWAWLVLFINHFRWWLIILLLISNGNGLFLYIFIDRQFIKPLFFVILNLFLLLSLRLFRRLLTIQLTSPFTFDSIRHLRVNRIFRPIPPIFCRHTASVKARKIFLYWKSRKEYFDNRNCNFLYALIFIVNGNPNAIVNRLFVETCDSLADNTFVSLLRIADKLDFCKQFLSSFEFDVDWKNVLFVFCWGEMRRVGAVSRLLVDYSQFESLSVLEVTL